MMGTRDVEIVASCGNTVKLTTDVHLPSILLNLTIVKHAYQIIPMEYTVYLSKYRAEKLALSLLDWVKNGKFTEEEEQL